MYVIDAAHIHSVLPWLAGWWFKQTELCHRYHTSNTAGPPHLPDSQQQPPSQPFGWNTSTSSSSSSTDRSAGQLPMRCQWYFCPFIHGVAENRRAQRTSDQRPIYKFKYRQRGSIGDGLDNLRRHNQQRHMREVTSSCSSSPACEGQRPMYQDAGEDAGDMQEGGANGAAGPVSPMEESGGRGETKHAVEGRACSSWLVSVLSLCVWRQSVQCSSV